MNRFKKILLMCAMLVAGLVSGAGSDRGNIEPARSLALQGAEFGAVRANSGIEVAVQGAEFRVMRSDQCVIV
jgi:hypothetical protein